MKDPRLSVICNEILREVPYIDSIILCGSRAKATTVSPYSDYDVIVVMRTCLIPIFLSKLEKVGKKLSERWEVKVGIDPMPAFRVRNAKGNLFLYKVKKEGLTIWGRNVIASLNPGEVKDIKFEWYFSYLSSLAKEVVQVFDPAYMYDLDQRDSAQLANSAAKALIGCGSLRLLLRGIYTVDPAVMTRKLQEGDHPNGRMAILADSPDFLRMLALSSGARFGLFEEVKKPLQLWLCARNEVLETFYVLVKLFLETQFSDVEKIALQYSRLTRNKSFQKNLQYLALTFLLKKQVFPRVILSQSLVADRLRFAVMMLLAAVEEHGSILRSQVDGAFGVLKGYVEVSYSDDDLSLWRSVKHSVRIYWPYACTVMGL